MSLPHLSLADARNLHLAAQGLLNKPRRRASLEDIPATISRMSLLQIDTINIVARSPYLVLFSRLGNYPAQWLDESLARGELMEYWAHEACFMPRSDFRLIRHRMLAPEKMGWKYKDAWMQEHEAEIAQLIQHIHDKGPVRSADFEYPRKGASGWWEWKPHKRHLEGLFTAGKVMVIERRNFQRVYDLTHRVMPDWDDERDLVSQTEAEIIMLDNSARSQGIFREQWLADYYRLKRPALAAWREARAEQRQIIAVHVEKLGNLWLHADLLPLLERALAGKLTATHSAVLSPFDPVVWDRKRAEQLFDFSYRLECYTPAPKRQYGY
ncbi:crosslink repair DNA glycosylase YcaQ, partial [Escherichia coli]